MWKQCRCIHKQVCGYTLEAGGVGMNINVVDGGGGDGDGDAGGDGGGDDAHTDNACPLTAA